MTLVSLTTLECTTGTHRFLGCKTNSPPPPFKSLPSKYPCGRDSWKGCYPGPRPGGFLGIEPKATVTDFPPLQWTCVILLTRGFQRNQEYNTHSQHTIGERLKRVDMGTILSNSARGLSTVSRVRMGSCVNASAKLGRSPIVTLWIQRNFFADFHF